MMKLISVSQVKIGMYIQELKSGWLSNPFWKRSFLIENQADLTKLKKSGIQQVVIDTKKGLDVDPEETIEDETLEISDSTEYDTEQQIETLLQVAEARTVAPKVTPLEDRNSERFPLEKKSAQRIFASEEREAASLAISASKKAVASMFNDVRMGKAINTEAAMPIVEELTASVIRNEGALISLVRLKTQDDYTYMHSVAVCALMVALARQLKLSDEETKQAGMAGLMHDIGKAVIPNEVLNKPGALTDEEFALVKLHPERGHELLLQAQVKDEVTLDVCLHHHEKIDGSGYPHHLNSAHISLFAKMGAVCDVYDAVTSNRAYKPGWEPGLSLQRMAKWTNHFDDLVFKAFVKSVGIFPIGTVVKLKSARLGVVIDQSPKSLLTPIVKVFFSLRDERLFTPEIVDLSDDHIEDGIVSQENPLDWGIHNINQYWAE